MRRNQKISTGGTMMLSFVLLNVIIVQRGYVHDPKWFYVLSLTLPLFVASIYFLWKKHP